MPIGMRWAYEILGSQCSFFSLIYLFIVVIARNAKNIGRFNGFNEQYEQFGVWIMDFN